MTKEELYEALDELAKDSDDHNSDLHEDEKINFFTILKANEIISLLPDEIIDYEFNSHCGSINISVMLDRNPKKNMGCLSIFVHPTEPDSYGMFTVGPHHSMSVMFKTYKLSFEGLKEYIQRSFLNDYKMLVLLVQ